MKSRSTSLFHFTKSRETLQLIVREGFWPRYCQEDMSWVEGYSAAELEGHLIAFPMVCFCDIPLSRIDEHVGFYGEFGVGLTREWALKNSLAPIIYAEADGPISRAMLKLNKLRHSTRAETAPEFEAAFDDLVRRIKPLEGTMFVQGKPIKKEFYQESEWRYIPTDEAIPRSLFAGDQVALQSGNDATRQHGMLRFTPQDIRFLFVPTDADIPPLVNFIQSELDQYPSSDLKILLSRITSLESLRRDW